MTYKAPVRDLPFALEEAADFGRLARRLPGRRRRDGGRGAGRRPASSPPTCWRRSTAPATWPARATRTAGVTAAPGFADAYRQFADGGWNGLAADPEFGGQGLPKALEIAVFEIIQAANLAFGLCPMLTQGAIEAIEKNGDAAPEGALSAQAGLRRMDRDDEPHRAAGGLGPRRAHHARRAATATAASASPARRSSSPGATTTWRTTSSTWCWRACPTRRPARAGISLFLAAEAAGDRGRLARRGQQPSRPAQIEHKLGIHASPTCVMLFEGAKAELVGAPNQGLAAMFVMMNAARLQVGVQGVAIAERAYQQALAYSLERKQGRSAWTGTMPSRLFDHPDVRRTLMLMKAKIEAARGICLSTAVAADLARTAGEPGRPRRGQPARGAADADRQGLVDRHGRRGRPRWRCRCRAAWASSRRPARRSTTATPASCRSTRAPTASRPST